MLSQSNQSTGSKRSSNPKAAKSRKETAIPQPKAKLQGKPGYFLSINYTLATRMLYQPS
jgi:hypothetical protein